MGFDHAQRSPNLKRFVLLVSSLVTGSVCCNVFLLLKEELRRETLANLQHMEKAEFSAKFGSGGATVSGDFLQRLDQDILSGTGQSGFATGFVFFALLLAAVVSFVLVSSLLWSFAGMVRALGDDGPEEM